MSSDQCVERSPGMRRSCEDVHTLSHLVSPKRRKLDVYGNGSVFRKYGSSVVISGSAQETQIHSVWCDHCELYAQIVKSVGVTYKLPEQPADCANIADVLDSGSVMRERINVHNIGSKMENPSDSNETEMHPKMIKYVKEASDYGMDLPAYQAMLVEYEQATQEEIDALSGKPANDSLSLNYNVSEADPEYKQFLRSSDGRVVFQTVIEEIGGEDDKGSLQGWTGARGNARSISLNLDITEETEVSSVDSDGLVFTDGNLAMNVSPAFIDDGNVVFSADTARLRTPVLAVDKGLVQSIAFHPSLVRVAVALSTGSVLIIDPIFPAERGITGLIGVTYVGAPHITRLQWATLSPSSSLSSSTEVPGEPLSSIVISNTSPAAAVAAKLPVPAQKQAIPVKDQGNPWHSIQTENDTLLVGLQLEANAVTVFPLYNGWFCSTSLTVQTPLGVTDCSVCVQSNNQMKLLITPNNTSSMSTIHALLKSQPTLPVDYLRAFSAVEEACFRLYHVFRALHVRWLVQHGVFYRKWLHVAKSFMECYSNSLSVLPSDIVQMGEENQTEDDLFVPNNETGMLDESAADLFSLGSPVKQPKTPRPKPKEGTTTSTQHSISSACICGDDSCYAKKDGKVDSCYILRREMLVAISSGVSHPILTTFFSQYNEIKGLERNFSACIDISAEMESIVTSQLMPLLMTLNSEGATLGAVLENNSACVDFASQCLRFVSDLTATRSFFNDFMGFWKGHALVAQAAEQVDPAPMRQKGLKMLDCTTVSRLRGFVSYCMDSDGGLLGSWFGADSVLNSACPLKMGAAWLHQVQVQNKLASDNEVGQYSTFYATDTEHQVSRLHSREIYAPRPSIYACLQKSMQALSAFGKKQTCEYSLVDCDTTLHSHAPVLYCPAVLSCEGRVSVSVASCDTARVQQDQRSVMIHTSGVITHLAATSHIVLLQYNTCLCGCINKQCEEAQMHVFVLHLKELHDVIVHEEERCKIILELEHSCLSLPAQPVIFLPSSHANVLLSKPQPVISLLGGQPVLTNSFINKEIFNTALLQVLGNRTDLLATKSVPRQVLWWNQGQEIPKEGSMYGFVQYLYKQKSK